MGLHISGHCFDFLTSTCCNISGLHKSHHFSLRNQQFSLKRHDASRSRVSGTSFSSPVQYDFLKSEQRSVLSTLVAA
jgi:hypothetical protein